MSGKVTKKQKQVLDFIQQFIEENNYSPSYREIMNGIGLSSVSAVAEHVENLIGLGRLRKVPGTARSLEVVGAQYPESVQLFNEKIAASEDETEIKILLQAAEILGLELD